eukprot:SAG31_NODE_1106_length_9878_cov_4.621331_9_plen_126_part_00
MTRSTIADTLQALVQNVAKLRSETTSKVQNADQKCNTDNKTDSETPASVTVGDKATLDVATDADRPTQNKTSSTSQHQEGLTAAGANYHESEGTESSAVYQSQLARLADAASRCLSAVVKHKSVG